MEYAQARYYNSQHGRFTSIDPLGSSATVRNPQTFNRYSYVLNSPYKFTDPLGLIAQGVRGTGNSYDAGLNSGFGIGSGPNITVQGFVLHNLGDPIYILPAALYNFFKFLESLRTAHLEVTYTLGFVNRTITDTDGDINYAVGEGVNPQLNITDARTGEPIGGVGYTISTVSPDGKENVLTSGEVPSNGILLLPSIMWEGQEGIVSNLSEVPAYVAGDIMKDVTPQTFTCKVTLDFGDLGTHNITAEITVQATASRTNGVPEGKATETGRKINPHPIMKSLQFMYKKK